ncbi:hypothetical protein FPQ18DRAFT_156223 [Pyronema domesticum]|nr:hypothetical protein FPQ18DRAFT_156223 [Pyronema domesticum]
MNYLYIATLYLTFSSTANVNASVLNNRGVLSSAIEAESPQQSSSEWDQQLTNATHSEYLQQKRGVSEPKIVKRDGSKSERALFRMLTGIASTVWRVAPVVYRDFHQLDYNEQYRVSFNKNGTALGPHSKYDFEFKDYAPDVFEFIRSNFEVDEDSYVESLTGNMRMDELASPGKSGGTFYFSTDKKYVIKTIHEGEHKYLREILPEYLAYVKSNPNTLLSQFYGLHRIKKWKGGKKYFVVMNNVFPPQNEIHQTWDLKGSTARRYVDEDEIAAKPKKTQQDVNWINKQMRLHFGPKKAEELLNQLARDAEFLRKRHVIDYSLLIGIHRIGNESVAITPSKSIFHADNGCFRSTNANDEPDDLLYCLGVIDILTYYTAWRAVDSFFTSFGIPSHTLSTVQPKTYARRFLKFIGDQIQPKSSEESEQNASNAETNDSSVNSTEISTDITTSSSSYIKNASSELAESLSPMMPNNATTESATPSPDTTTMPEASHSTKKIRGAERPFML